MTFPIFCNSTQQFDFLELFDVKGKEVLEQRANIKFYLKLRKTAKETYEIKFSKLFTEKAIPFVSSNGLKDSELVARMFRMG